MYDILIIGCGVVGASIAFELSKYNLKIGVMERENDVSEGATKANSAIAHAGYDAEPGTLMARFNIAGSEMMESLCRDLSIHYKRCGSLVIAFSEEEKNKLCNLLERGRINGVRELRLIEQDELREIEPLVSRESVAALYAPTGAIISPWELCIAQIETAVKNGCELFLNSPVDRIEKIEGGFAVFSGERFFKTRYIVNSAGIYADKVHNLISKCNEFEIFPNKGEYYILDNSQGGIAKHVLFQLPSEKGKGVLIAPTVHGNIIIGPDSIPVNNRESKTTTPEGLAYVRETALKTLPLINFRFVIRTFMGLRAYSSENDFIIRESADTPGFINVAGIKSPGLTSAPAIAPYVRELLENIAGAFVRKDHFIAHRDKIEFKKLSDEEKNKLIKEEPSYGRIVCRCEGVTEGDIKNALSSVISPVSVDGVKRRTCAGFGRCQGSFCSPRVISLIASHHGKNQEDVFLDKEGTYLLTGVTKQGGDHEAQL